MLLWLTAKFKDAAGIMQIGAQRQVAYAVERVYVKVCQTELLLGCNLNSKAFIHYPNQMGYDGDFTYDNAAFDLSKFGEV